MKLTPVIPFEPISSSKMPEGENWITQIKWDGIRMLHYFDGTETRLFNRKMNERTLQYPELLDTQKFCRADSVILDGEIICLDNNKPSFHEVMRRESLKQRAKIQLAVNQIPVSYMVFDILYFNGEWVTDRSLRDRQKLLHNVLVPNDHVQIVPNFTDGHALFEVMKQHQMEGVVYKDLQSTYSLNGKDGRWRKHKIFVDLYAVVGGVTFRDRVVNSLLLGLYDDEGKELTYIGHAGTGKLTRKDWMDITALVNESAVENRPFVNVPLRQKDAVWIRPALTVKVEFLEFTPAKTMRHPSIQAIVDVSPQNCTLSQLQ
ncbi:DNA ligase [Paenibacillus sp. 1P03SA]|uniref:ATP-dependent DNA ligase n=1 Tax=Paenibacillus sp. 1P03SA TaxID=3132294 RepID=UPI0039A2F7A5